MSEAPHSLRLKSLHAEYDIRDVDIRPFVEQVRTQGMESLPLKLDSKIRRNVLTVLVTEDYWDYVENMEAASPETFGLPEEDIESIVALIETEKLPAVIKGIRGITEKHLLMCAEFCDYFPDPIVEELKDLQFLDPKGIKLHTPYPDRFTAGVENANMMGWESIHQVPYLLQRQSPEEPVSISQYQEVARRNITFLRNLARTNMLMFGAAHTAGRFQGFPSFSPTFLTLTGKNDALHMDLSPALKDHIDLFRDEIQGSLSTGCPALLAKSVAGTDVVTAMYQWIQRIADRLFFPRAKEILARSDLSEMGAFTEILAKALNAVTAHVEQKKTSDSA